MKQPWQYFGFRLYFLMVIAGWIAGIIVLGHFLIKYW